MLTDLPPSRAEPLWYGMRGWIEHGFRLLKSDGWQWQATRMTDPERVGRLWLALAVATGYVLAVGGEAETASEAEALRRSRRRHRRRHALRRPIVARCPCPRRAPERRPTGTTARQSALVSIFGQGLAALTAVLASGHVMPKPHWRPEPWLEIQTAITTPPGQPPTPIPKTPSL